MNAQMLAVGALLAATAAVVAAAPVPGCEARSGPSTAALVELYTSEGCSSCPPADQQLSRLRESLGPTAAVVPLALHVDYWDYIGWKDPYSQGAFAKRQHWLASENQQQFVYTPHFFVSGTELRSTQGAMRDEVKRTNAKPAEAQVRVEARLSSAESLTLNADATASAASQADLYLAVTESGLVSKVSRGENGGSTLSHDYVVRAWIGPIALNAGQARVQREVSLPESWNRDQLEIVGFVEDRRSGRVLQAVGAEQCFRS